MEKITRYAWQVILIALLACKNEPTVISTAGGASESTTAVDGKYADNIVAGKYKILLNGQRAIVSAASQTSDRDFGKIIMTSRWHNHGAKKRKGLFSAWHHVSAWHHARDVDEIWINIKEIRLVSETGTIVTVSTKEQSVNLLEVKDDASVLFADTLLPQGKYDQIRLVLADDNGHVLKNGREYPLVVPSSDESGLKLKGQFTIVSGLLLRLSLDFSVHSLIFKLGRHYIMV